MKVLFLDTVHPLLERRLINMGFNCEYDYSSNRISILRNISVYDGIIIRSRIKIDIGFLSNTTKSNKTKKINNSQFEIVREDHSKIIDKI